MGHDLEIAKNYYFWVSELPPRITKPGDWKISGENQVSNGVAAIHYTHTI